MGQRQYGQMTVGELFENLLTYGFMAFVYICGIAAAASPFMAAYYYWLK